MRQILLETEPAVLRITRIPNARLLTEVRAHHLLTSQNKRPATVGDLRQALQELPSDAGVDPEDILTSFNDLTYDISIRWPGADVDGSYEVVFQRRIATEMQASELEDTSLLAE